VDKRNVVGERIKLARKEAKPPITQLHLVARLQVLGMQIDKSGLSKIENGRRPVSDFEVIALARALKVPAAWLLQESNDLSIR
jgi:transcriptional regulator with XRE-family HTH domain